MNQFGGNKAMIKGYRGPGLNEVVASATPHRLIQMLMEGALDRVASARGHMQRGETAGKGAQISWAISIIDGLRVSLDKSVGGDIAQNLDDLYNYMMLKLTEANLKNEPALLDEVADLLRQIKTAWDAIPPETIREHAGQDAAPMREQAG